MKILISILIMLSFAGCIQKTICVYTGKAEISIDGKIEK